MKTSLFPNVILRTTLLTASMMLSLGLIAGCNGSDGSDGADGADGAAGDAGPRGLPLLVEAERSTPHSPTYGCWAAEHRLYGYDTSGDGEIDDIALTETACNPATPEIAVSGKAVLYFQDSDATPEFMDTLQALEAEGVLELFHTTDASEFETLLEEERIDVVFYMIQRFPINEESANRLADWVSDGGRLIYTTWNTDDTTVPTALEAEFSGATNLEQASFDNLYLGWQLDDPSDVTNPATWTTYSRGLTPTDQGLSVCT